jgi:hypothetical protein
MHVGTSGQFCLHHLHPKPAVKPGKMFASLTVSFTVQLQSLTSILGKIGHEVAAKTESWIWLRTQTTSNHSPQLDTNQLATVATVHWCCKLHLNSLLSSLETNDCQSLKLISSYFNHQIRCTRCLLPCFTHFRASCKEQKTAVGARLMQVLPSLLATSVEGPKDCTGWHHCESNSMELSMDGMMGY